MGRTIQYAIDPGAAARLTIVMPAAHQRDAEPYRILLDGAELGRVMHAELVAGKDVRLPDGSMLRLLWKYSLKATRDGIILPPDPTVVVRYSRVVLIAWASLYAATFVYALSKGAGGTTLAGAAIFSGVFLGLAGLLTRRPILAAALAIVLLAYHMNGVVEFAIVPPALVLVPLAGLSLLAPLVTVIFLFRLRKLPVLPRMPTGG